MPPTLMLVTTGTSIFTSGSWRPEGPFAEIPGYERWVNESTYRDSPKRRETMCEQTKGRYVTGSSVREAIEDLAKRNPAVTSAHLDTSIDHPARYSAEVATILQMYQIHRRHDDRQIRDFLAREYSSIQVLCSSDQRDPSWLASWQVQAHLQQLAPELADGQIAVVPCINGSSFAVRVGSFCDHLRTLANHEVHVVSSGGYKVYSSIAGRFLAHDGWRVIYLHETAQTGDLVDEDRDGIKIGNSRLPIERVPL